MHSKFAFIGRRVEFHIQGFEIKLMLCLKKHVDISRLDSSTYCGLGILKRLYVFVINGKLQIGSKETKHDLPTISYIEAYYEQAKS